MTSDPLRRLKTLGRDLSTIPISRLDQSFQRACFICVNTYTSYRLSLGAGPLNDAVSVAKMAALRHLNVFFLHNPRKAVFLRYLDAFLQRTEDHLVVFYVGHGTQVVDLDGDESDGMDEAMVFEDGNVIDDTLVEHLQEFKHPESQVTLLTDACYSGTIWDLNTVEFKGRKAPENVISISSANDKQTAKQTYIDRLEQGVFTYNLYKLVKQEPEITPAEIKVKLTKTLRKYGQTCTINSTTQDIIDATLFD